MQNRGDPVADRLLTWIHATEARLPMEAAGLMAFVRENPGWPRLHVFRDNIEKNINSARLTPEEVAAWFDENPPQGFDGIRARMRALLALRRQDAARAALSAFWTEASLSRGETAALAATYKNHFAPGAHAARLDALLWAERLEEAEYMLAFADPAARRLGQARIALARNTGNVDALVAAVPARLQADEGLLFDRARWRRKKNRDDGALEIIRTARKSPARQEAWWKERNVLARRAMERRDWAAAAAIADGHGLAPGSAAHAQAEWLLAWLRLRFLDEPQKAYAAFESLYGSVTSSVSKSRAAYWAARAAEKLRLPDAARNWDRTAARYVSTYYGQLSYQKVYGAPGAGGISAAAIPPETARAFDADERARAARLLHKAGLGRLADPFLARLLADAQSHADFRLVALLAREIRRPYYVVQANKEMQMRLGAFMPDEGYPDLSFSPPPAPEKALVHAIIYRESMFDPEAVSHAGARGLMQLMPATAKSMARRKRLGFSAGKLTADPQYNVTLGAVYLDELVRKYDGCLPLAIAAYNAGPGNVAKWIALYGHPKNSTTDALVDWIELIPVYETRNYVQRVLETWYLYRLRQGRPAPVLPAG